MQMLPRRGGLIVSTQSARGRRNAVFAEAARRHRNAVLTEAARRHRNAALTEAAHRGAFDRRGIPR
ncbi:hypothetical protein [Brevibacterium sp. 'Marine']|uniref:hypothetical protein n=1 Tax=Brevibacterium sp. 'Marine' TaxID=2725563 RepID=UPI00145C4A90|nr:hypothetical protein [Brevibacterium sp. 'Marine']